MLDFKTFAIGSTLAIASLASFAQATPRADQREANQEARIQNGVASGQLNARETHRLDKQQGRIHTAEANAKADGKVTPHERRKLERMQDRASKDIHAQKHDAQTGTR